MNYLLKKDVMILVLYIILTVVLVHKKDRAKVKYWSIVKSFIIVLGTEPMLEELASSFIPENYVIIYTVLEWLVVNFAYVLAGLIIYEACMQEKREHESVWKEMPAWIRRGIVLVIALGGVLSGLNIHYEMDMIDTLYENLYNGTYSLMDSLTSGSLRTPYYEMKELMRSLNLSGVIGALIIQGYRKKDK